MSTRLCSCVLTALALGACDAPLRPLSTTMCHEARAASAGGETELHEPTDAEWVRLLTDDGEAYRAANTSAARLRCSGNASRNFYDLRREIEALTSPCTPPR